VNSATSITAKAPAGSSRSDGGRVRLDRRHLVHGELCDIDHRESSGWEQRHGQGHCDDAFWHVASLLREHMKPSRRQLLEGSAVGLLVGSTPAPSRRAPFLR
jgi:hypothetical protein